MGLARRRASQNLKSLPTGGLPNFAVSWAFLGLATVLVFSSRNEAMGHVRVKSSRGIQLSMLGFSCRHVLLSAFACTSLPQQAPVIADIPVVAPGVCQHLAGANYSPLDNSAKKRCFPWTRDSGCSWWSSMKRCDAETAKQRSLNPCMSPCIPLHIPMKASQNPECAVAMSMRIPEGWMPPTPSLDDGGCMGPVLLAPSSHFHGA